MFTEAIIKYASEDIKQEILPKLISGEVIGTLAVTEEFCAPTASNMKTEVNNNLISGKKIAVPDAGIATHSIIVVKSDSGISLQLINHSSDEVVVSHQENIDESRGHFSITLDNAPCKLIGDTLNGWDLFESLMDQAAVLFSFEQLGGSQASLDMAVGYAKERYAFGRPIGSFQAIKHKLADMYIALTLAKSNCYYAAWALTSDSSDLPTAAATARVSSTKAYQFCSKENIQTHGGNGFTTVSYTHLTLPTSDLV